MPAEAGKPRRDRIYGRFPKPVRQLLVGVAGATLLLAGLVMLVLPGPGLLALAAGLAILALEFHWARRFLEAVRARLPGASRR